MQTLGHRFASRETAGFDYARLGLALAVVFWHNFGITAGMESLAPYKEAPIMVLVRVILPMFFALSGFLVSASLERAPNLPVFLWHRFLRIYPALTVEVLLSAFILGTILTVVPLRDYFFSLEFVKYIFNIIGWIHFRLPGVFLENPISGIVNSSLWTVPSELECYIAISILFVLGFTRSTKLLAFAFLAAVLVLTARKFPYDEEIFYNVDKFHLVLSFVAGMLVYQLRFHLAGGFLTAILAFAVSCILLYFPATQYVASFPAAYAIAAFGCTKLPKSKLIFGGDYSYGLYLYAYPIQQTVVHIIGPGKFWMTLVYSLLAMVVFAVFSWHAIEKHFLQLRNSLPWLLMMLRLPTAAKRVAEDRRAVA